MGAQPADSLRADTLREVEIITVAPVKAIKIDSHGKAILSRRGLQDMPSFMGSNDIKGLLSVLPAVATTNDLQASLNVNGSSSGDNLYLIDDIRISNPLHMLGFYSAYNPDFFSGYEFSSGYIPATGQTATSAILGAFTPWDLSANMSLSASIGLIESHMAIAAPISRDRLSMTAGFRTAYPTKVFPDMLKMGTSHLNYGFYDANLAVLAKISDKEYLKISGFFTDDDMIMEDRHLGAKDGKFGWRNYGAGACWHHREMSIQGYFSGYRNRLLLSQGGRMLNLPSGLDQVTLRALLPLGEHWQVSADCNWRQTLGQHNGDLKTPNGLPAQKSLEASFAGEWNKQLLERLHIAAGLKMGFYHADKYFRFAPQPRLAISYRPSGNSMITAGYQRLMRFDRLITASSSGFPSDFWVSASRNIAPEDVSHEFISFLWHIPKIGGTINVDFFAKQLRHSFEFKGSIMDLISPTYEGLQDLIDGRANSYGLSAMAMRQFGRLRFRVGYTLSRTDVRAPYFGEGKFPASYDRTNDLKASIAWQAVRWLQFSGVYVYATGLPYTKAQYGYIIGENIICEYFPHNSSRLPDYHRLDLSASVSFTSKWNLNHKFTISVYNALKNSNTLFKSINYSISEGISHQSSVMDMVIPALTYTITLE